jgi:NTE family protein
MHPSFQDDLLHRHLHDLLGPLEPETLALLQASLDWVTVPGGQPLMTQGEAGDAMFLAISGRLRAYVRGDDGQERVVREMARGQIIGEMSLYTDQPRSATVVAVRDSVLVRLGKPAFHQLLASSPRLSMLLTRQLIQRLQAPPARADQSRPVVLTLMPITAGIDLPAFAARLAAQLATQARGADGQAARVCLVDADRLDQALQQPGLARLCTDGAGDAQAGAAAQVDQRIGLQLDALEAAHDFVLLLADDQATPWTQRCSRRCDELLLLADADAPPQLHPSETGFLMPRADAAGRRSEAAETLVLLHPADRRSPSHTRRWLDRRPLAGHLHIRPTLDRDMARLARLQAGTAVGLVLAGGGARGLAHLGILQALQADGIEVDVVGGTSIGAVMAALCALDRPLDETLAVARTAFSGNPTGDFNWLPLVSLIAGRRLRRIVHTALLALAGDDIDAEDLWKTFYCVASNYSQAREQVITRGPLQRALLASIAIPGALPPVLHDGDLLCDGGTFNNFPVDLMRVQRGVGQVIGVDLSQNAPRRIDLQEIPGTWALLRDRLRGRRRRRFRLPSLVAYLMNVTILYSNSRQRQAQQLTDLYFNPPLHRVGMLQWARFDSIVAQGFAHGQQVLAQRAAAAAGGAVGD